MRKGEWYRGIGNDSRKVYDSEGHLICETIRSVDGTLIVDAVNAYNKDENRTPYAAAVLNSGS